MKKTLKEKMKKVKRKKGPNLETIDLDLDNELLEKLVDAALAQNISLDDLIVNIVIDYWERFKHVHDMGGE